MRHTSYIPLLIERFPAVAVLLREPFPAFSRCTRRLDGGAESLPVPTIPELPELPGNQIHAGRMNQIDYLFEKKTHNLN